MRTLDDLAQAVDAAADAADEPMLRRLGKECESRMATAKDQERVFLRYYQANVFASIISSKHTDADYTWSWEEPDRIQNILLLRQAINEPAFETVDSIVECQIRTNLANLLSYLGRPVSANEQLLSVLDICPRFAKALANRAEVLASYGGTLYDNGHEVLLLAAARSSFDAALDPNSLWESGDRDSIAPDLMMKRDQIVSYLKHVNYDEHFDMNQWSLGTSARERSYRRWCLQERLFLNPLNDIYTDAVAATDVLHLPDHRYSVYEKPRFPAYYNIMKQEYVTARYRLYRAIHEEGSSFLMRDVLLIDSGEGQVFGEYTEDLRSAFRSSYAIFDKIAMFLNDYFQVGLKPRDVSFRRIWSERSKGGTVAIRSVFENRPNLPLRGLYFLSKDLYDSAFTDVASPESDDLASLRQQLEHRFLSLQHFVTNESTDTHRFVLIDEFKTKALRLLKMAREALIYVSLAMYIEETTRHDEKEGVK